MDPTEKIFDFNLPRKISCALNRLRTDHARPFLSSQVGLNRIFAVRLWGAIHNRYPGIRHVSYESYPIRRFASRAELFEADQSVLEWINHLNMVL